MTHNCPTRPDQALLFRLSADRSPVHVDPVLARQQGLAGPSLQGLCLQGIACHAILQVICEYDHTLIRSLAVSSRGPGLPRRDPGGRALAGRQRGFLPAAGPGAGCGGARPGPLRPCRLIACGRFIDPRLSVRLRACRGAVAQLGERRVRNAEAGSSILPGSTNSESSPVRRSPINPRNCGFFRLWGG